MANINKLSPDLELIIEKAGSIATKNRQTWVGTPHIFMATTMFLGLNQSSERYADTYNKLKAFLNENGIVGEKFQEAFEATFAVGMKLKSDTTFQIKWHEEGVKVFDNLKREAELQKRQMQVEDLLRELFSDKSYRLHQILEAILGSTQKVDALCKKVLEEFKIAKKLKIEALEKMPELTNLNEYVKANPPVAINMNSAVKQIELGLNGRSISNVIVVGAAGVGKSLAVLEFVKRVNDKNVTKSLREKIIYQLDPGRLVAGTRYRGDFEEKLMNILKVVKEHKDIILFIDEAHMMTKLGDADGAASAGNIIKPFISRGELQMIWATTEDDYAKYIQNEKALARRFHKVNVSEPSKEQTKEILLGLVPTLEKYFGKKCSPDLIEKVVNLSEKYSIEQANPAKAINMLELAFANSKVFNEENEIIFTQDIIDAIRIRYNIIVNEGNSTEIQSKLKKFILGQDTIIDKVTNYLKLIDKGLVDHEKPKVSFIFAGPTGVGKTELAKQIAKEYCGSEKQFIKVNMGEYGTEMDVTKITGSAPGYVGHEDESGLVAMIKQYPNSVVLFDEIEKAHPKVFDTLLNILDTGEMTDNHKNRVSFRNAIIIFTTNLGYEKDFAKAKGVGFVKSKTENTDIKNAVEKHFRPEFINRIDEIVVFNGLNQDVADSLIERYLNDYKDLMVTKEDIKLTKEDVEEIKKIAEIEVYGARGLKRAVRKQMLKVLERSEEELKEKKAKPKKEKVSK